MFTMCIQFINVMASCLWLLLLAVMMVAAVAGFISTFFLIRFSVFCFGFVSIEPLNFDTILIDGFEPNENHMGRVRNKTLITNSSHRQTSMLSVVCVCVRLCTDAITNKRGVSHGVRESIRSPFCAVIFVYLMQTITNKIVLQRSERLSFSLRLKLHWHEQWN